MNYIGREATVKARDSFHYGDWGIIVDFDGDYFHIAIFGDDKDVCVFARDEIKIERPCEYRR